MRQLFILSARLMFLLLIAGLVCLALSAWLPSISVSQGNDRQMGVRGVDSDSGWYKGRQVAGTVLMTATGGGEGMFRLSSSRMASVALTDAEHQIYSNAFRSALPYGVEHSPEAVADAISRVYANDPELLQIALEQIGGG